ncbi:hypothetical protein EZH22_24655 [Xanthobacter dioxanivorans]|uniref:Uncharacterized protein n=1 Tax=Xanthobacter dioxanivorans TaxID=2528964 RepID=A0A974PMP9_9HYPH|nr:hypothetical protein [Xanthobacter dioxanivorans]QRG06141.1 hypothetical protein EZH22_24655 [Xanthobacter dioxanivorans]
MSSEMQERIARAIWESRNGKPAPDKYWAHQVKALRELADEFPEYPLGGDGVSDAFRDALAVMKAMREPTPEMEKTGDGFIDFGSDFTETWRAALDAEITLAEGGSRDRD